MAGKLKGLAALRAAGAIRSSAPVVEQITWTNDAGEAFTFDLHFSPMSFGMALDLEADSSQDRKAAMLGRLVLLEGEDGKLAPMGPDTARALHPRLGYAIVSAFNRLNTGEPKNSVPPTSSSANSSSTESAATPSQTPETA